MYCSAAQSAQRPCCSSDRRIHVTKNLLAGVPGMETEAMMKMLAKKMHATESASSGSCRSRNLHSSQDDDVSTNDDATEIRSVAFCRLGHLPSGGVLQKATHSSGGILLVKSWQRRQRNFPYWATGVLYPDT